MPTRHVRQLLVTTLLTAVPAAASDVSMNGLVADDQAVREAAFKEFAARGSDAREVLRQLAAGEDPAASEAARRLLLGIESGLASIPPEQRTQGLAEAVLVAAAVDLDDPKEAARFLSALNRLLRQPAVAAPALAVTIERLVADDANLKSKVNRSALERLALLHQPFNRQNIDVRARSAVVAELLALPEGEKKLRRWLSASVTARTDDGDQRFAKFAVAAADPQSPLSRWASGESANWPDDLPWPASPSTQFLSQTAHAILYGLAAPEPEGQSELDAAVAAVAVALADLQVMPEELAEADARLVALAEADAIPYVAALAGRPTLAARLAEQDPRTTLGLLWITQQYEAFATYPVPAEAGGLAGVQRNIVLQRLKPSPARGRTPRAAEGFAPFIDIAFAAADGESPRALLPMLRRLQQLDRAVAGWHAVAARIEGDEGQQSAAERIALDDPSRRLEMAHYLDAFATDEADRSRAIEQAKRAVAWAMLRSAEQDGYEAILSSARDAALIAEEAGRYDEALRFHATCLLLVSREDIRDKLNGRWHDYLPTASPTAQALVARTATHTARALALQAAGDDDGFALERDRVKTLVPNDTTLVIGRVRFLDAAGRTDEATATFTEAFRVLQKQLQVYETSPMLANQAAWLASRSRRRPDTAARYAALATAGAPGVAAYLDTLAEVHLARGDHQDAFEAMRSALAVSRDSEYPIFVRRLRDMKDEFWARP